MVFGGFVSLNGPEGIAIFESISRIIQMNYSNIQEPPSSYTSGNIISRFINGLTFRYYWATEKLTSEDLDHKPCESSMSSLETIEHMLWLTELIKNALLGKESHRTFNQEMKGTAFSELRQLSLSNLELASAEARKKAPEDLETIQILIRTKDKDFSFPLWNLINGPLSDFMYHTGQIVSFRRASGNPIPKGVNHLLGKGAY